MKMRLLRHRTEPVCSPIMPEFCPPKSTKKLAGLGPASCRAPTPCSRTRKPCISSQSAGREQEGATTDS
jgi:hypothetical protein